MSKITDYSNFYRELGTVLLKDTHWILDLPRNQKKKNKNLRYYFESDELSEKTLSFLLFNKVIARDGLRNFLERLEEVEFFFDYDAVFDRFDEMFLTCALSIARDNFRTSLREVPSKVAEVADHWNLWMDILYWTRKLCFNQLYLEKFAEGGEPWNTPVFSSVFFDRTKS